jgi:accessory gene regulator B
MDNDTLIGRISNWLARESGQDQEVLLYGLTLVKSFFLGYGFLLLVSFIFGVWSFSLTAAVTASVFRVFSGGAHASSPIRCTIIGVVLFTGFGALAGSVTYTAEVYPFITLTFTAIFLLSFIVFYRYAPADTPGKPISSQAQKKYLRTISFSLFGLYCVSVFLFVNSFSGYPYMNYLTASMLGFFWQVFTLTPLGYSLYHAADSFLKYFTKGG